jgi:hypothetical protein
VASPDLIVEATLEDSGLGVPDPGNWTIPLMRYAVERVLEGEYPHRELYVGHEHAHPNAPEFQVGARHRLRLTHTFPDQASILTPWDVRDHGAFYCLGFDPVAETA